MRSSLYAACAAILFAAAPALADSGAKWELSTGVDFSSGSYGAASDTETLYVPATVRANGESWRFEVTVPWMRIEGPGNVVGGIDAPIIVVPGDSTTTTNSGLGDVIVGASWITPYLGEGLPFLELKGKVKLPTAQAGLGTEETDFSLQLDFYQVVGPNLTLIATGGYQRLGDLDTVELNDGFIGTLGFSAKPSASADAGVLFDYREASTDGTDDQMSLVPFVSWRAGESWGLTGYGVIGLSDASPDYGIGVQFTLYR